MLDRTRRRLDSFFESLHEDIEADMAEVMKTDLGPLPEGTTEDKTVEEEHRPDGTYVKRIIIRRSSVTVTKK